MIELNITGIREIEQRLARLEDKVRNKIIKDAVKGGAKPVLLEGRANIASMVGGEMGGRMKKALGVRVWKHQRRGAYGVSVRFLSEKDDLKRKKQIGVGTFTGYKYGSASSIRTKKLLKTVGGTYYIPAAIEYGHAFPGRGGGKSAPKDVPAIPYFRKAVETQKAIVESVMRYAFIEGIERAAIGG